MISIVDRWKHVNKPIKLIEQYRNWKCFKIYLYPKKWLHFKFSLIFCHLGTYLFMIVLFRLLGVCMKQVNRNDWPFCFTKLCLTLLLLAYTLPLYNVFLIMQSMVSDVFVQSFTVNAHTIIYPSNRINIVKWANGFYFMKWLF